MANKWPKEIWLGNGLRWSGNCQEMSEDSELWFAAIALK